MRRKYGNHKVENAFGVFDSTLEWDRFLFLQNRQKEGEISDLKRQVEFLLLPSQYRKDIKHLKTKDKEYDRLVERACTYKADFTYIRDGRLVVEDCKGSREIITEASKLKKKLLLYIHNIELKYIYVATFWEKSEKK